MAKLTVADFYNPKCFKVWNYKLSDNPIDLIINSIALLIGNYEAYRKRAALLILKAFVRDEFLKSLLDDGTYPFDRNDPRVRKWTKDIVSIGYCEKCNSTERLEAHHILYWSEYPPGRIDLNNGICLCNTCHGEMHKGEICEKLILSRI